MCALIQTVTCEYLKARAFELDPSGALGICWADMGPRPAIDMGSAIPPDGLGTISADALAFIEVYQRLYEPAAVGGLSI
jgi:hypothetical protein